MLIGYVSDERYVALPGVHVELISPAGSVATTSRATGSVHADVAPGRYEVVLAKDGYGAKRVTLDLPTSEPHQFRLLPDDLLGYAWPKWVRGGEASEFRVHSDAAYKLDLWRYGWQKELVRPIGWFDEHGPRATMQITPDGDYTQTGVQWNKFGYASPHHKQFVTAPERSGLYYFHAKSEAGRFFSFPWIVAPATAASEGRRAGLEHHLERLQQLRRPQQLHPSRPAAADADGQRPPGAEALHRSRARQLRHDRLRAALVRPARADQPRCPSTCRRPTRSRAGRLPPRPGRVAALGWLEREGFDYDYYAETQLHFGQLDLDAYRVLVISTHPEYWSRADVRPRQGLGLRARRPARLPRAATA